MAASTTELYTIVIFPISKPTNFPPNTNFPQIIQNKKIIPLLVINNSNISQYHVI